MFVYLFTTYGKMKNYLICSYSVIFACWMCARDLV